jgi:hypothetical protein
MSNLNNNIIHIPLHDGTWVEERLYNQVLQLIREIVPALEVEQVYTAKMLCGKAFWDSLKKGERIKAGKCVVDMVLKNLLPLHFAETTKANSQQYKLK